MAVIHLASLAVFMLVFAMATAQDGLASGTQIQKSVTACQNNIVALTCNSGYTIKILTAFWGRGDSVTCSEDAAQSDLTDRCSERLIVDLLKTKCEDKQSCQVPPTTGVLGNPCEVQSTVKYLRVEYVCEAIEYNALTCENSGKLSFACPENKVIVPNKAFYGRDDYNTTCPHLSAVGSSFCKSNNSLDVFKQMCKGKTHCEMDARVQVFGDPCPGSYKYLRLGYSCADCINEIGDDAYCEFQANLGECTANPEWMTLNCRKSCWKCDKEAIPFENAYGNDTECTGWALDGQCTSNFAWMTAYCRKACLDRQQDPLTECKNKYDIDFDDGEEDCPRWYNEGQCVLKTHYMFWDCTKSCFGCGTDEIMRCEDKHPNNTACEEWALAGECEKNPGFMIAKCQKTCLACTSDPVCKNNPDFDAQCDGWEAIGECDTNPVFMHTHCWKSCIKCQGIQPQTECVNVAEDATCEYWRGVGECDKSSTWMLENCRKTCTKCDLPVDAVADCLNVWSSTSECEDWGTQDQCITNPNWMLPNCRSSCTLCDEPSLYLNKTGAAAVPGKIQSFTGAMSFMLPGVFPAKARLTHFGAYFAATHHVYLVVWRPDGQNGYTEVYKQRVEPYSSDIAETILVTDCVNVEAGDKLGFSSLGGSPSPIAVNFIEQGNLSEQTAFRLATSSASFAKMVYPYRFSLYAGYDSNYLCT